MKEFTDKELDELEEYYMIRSDVASHIICKLIDMVHELQQQNKSMNKKLINRG